MTMDPITAAADRGSRTAAQEPEHQRAAGFNEGGVKVAATETFFPAQASQALAEASARASSRQ